MKKQNQTKLPSRRFQLCVDPLLAKHLKVVKKEVRKVIADLGKDCPGVMLHRTKEVGDDIVVLTIYLKGRKVVVVHPITEARLLEKAFLSLLPCQGGTWPKVTPGTPDRLTYGH